MTPVIYLFTYLLSLGFLGGGGKVNRIMPCGFLTDPEMKP